MESSNVNEDTKDINNKPSRSYGATSKNKNNDGPLSPSVYTLRGKNPMDSIENHCHREREEGVDVHARRTLIIASILCLGFMIAEIIGGVLSNSLAIATDAAHLLTDFASFMISLFAISLAARPSTQRMSFGWHRAEIIGALISVSMIWVITGVLVWLAIERIITGEYEVDATIMLITSSLGILANLLMGFQLYKSGHGHSHGGLSPVNNIDRHEKPIEKEPTTVPELKNEVSSTTMETESSQTGSLNSVNHVILDVDSSDDKTSRLKPSISDVNIAETTAPPKKQKRFKNLNVRAAFVHVIGDVLQSVGVFIAAVVIFFKPSWGIVDPICTFLFSIIVLFTTWNIIKDAVLVLMEATPNNLPYCDVINTFQSIEGVERVHNLRIWALSLNKVTLAVHLAIAPGYDPKKILKEASSAVHTKYNFYETTIQIEDATEDMKNCEQCEVPKK